jgi:3-oxoacyl-[acyl-carrier-protein] synthase-3
MRIAITAIETYLPEKVVSNEELSKELDTSDEWIKSRTGINSRHLVADGEVASDIGAKAAMKIFQNSNLSPSDIDAIIVATTTSDIKFPSCAAKIQKNINAMNAFAFDINAACSGFIYGLRTAECYIKSGAAERVLLIGVDTLSLFVDWTDRSTCVLFGDGAGACILEESSDDRGLIATKLYCDGSKHDLILACRGPQNDHRGYTSMVGRAVFKHGIELMYRSIYCILKDVGMSYNDVDWIIPHQANRRMIESLCSMKGVPIEKILFSIGDHANTSSASIPLALKKFIDDGVVKTGDVILVTAVGAGLVYGSSIFVI